MLQVNASIVLRYEGDGTATIVGRHNRDNIDEFHVGERLPAEEHSAFARVLATGAPARIDDWGGLTGEVAEAIFRTGYRSTAAAPIVVAGTLWGAVAIASENPLPPETEERLGGVLRARVAGRRQRSGARRPHRVARAPGQGRRRAAAQAGAQPARRRPAALRLRRAEAAPGPRAPGLASRGHGRPAGGRLARARHRAAGAARDRARAASGDPRRPRAAARAGGARRAAPPRRWTSTPAASGCPSTSRRRRTTSSPRR